MPKKMHINDYQELGKAKKLLEETSFAFKVLDYCGRPVEWAMGNLPKKAQGTVAEVSRKSIEKALEYACWTIPSNGQCWDRAHMLTVMGTGAAGGFFGMSALPFELPFSTMLILRSMAEIAQGNGESLQSPETRLACVQVFALGGRTSDDDNLDNAYLTLRCLLANEMRLAVAYLAKEANKEVQPVLIRLIQTVATRFSIVVEEKLIAQSIPVIGALGGATINAAFMDHFQDKAKGHFIFRRLERRYGAAVVEDAYRSIRLKQ